MQPAQVKIVQSTFEAMAPKGEQLTETFYKELFTRDPSLKPLFKGDLKEQRRKLLASIAMVVRALHAPEPIIPAVQALGKRHVDYGVKPEHYDTVGAALLGALEKEAGPAFTPEVKEAWAGAYTLLAGIMKQAAYGA